MSFSQQKRNYYPGTQTVAPSANAQGVVAGNPAMKPQGTVAAGTGETPEEFATARQAYNMFANRGNQPTKPAGTVVEEPATKPQGTVSKPVVTGGGSVAAGGVMPYTGGNDNAQAALDYLGALYTSPQEEERRRKASVANQRIMAVGDALRHIGNIYNTVQGAPSQTFTNPVQEEYARYQQAKALRDRANQQYYTYQQQKAAQDALAARWAADYKLKAEDAMRKAGYTEAQIQNMKDRLEQQKAYQEAMIENAGKRIEETTRHNKVSEKQRQQSIGIAANNSKSANAYRRWRMNGGGGGRSGGTLTLRGKNGFYTKNMSSNDVNAFYNQAFETLANTRLPNGKTVIDRKAVSGEVIPGLFGGNKINMQARKQAVDNAIANYPEAGDLLRNTYEFDFDPRGAQQPSQSVQQNPNVFFSPWNTNQQASSGYGSTFTPFADEDDDLFDEEDFSGISI